MLGRVVDLALLLPRLLVGAQRVTMPKGFSRELVLRDSDFGVRVRVGGRDPIQGLLQQLRQLHLGLVEKLGADGAVALCSPKAGEGRSMIATNLAITMAHDTGRPVVLMDLDLADPHLHELLDLEASPGFTDFHEGASVDVMLQPTGVPGLQVITAGSQVVDSARLLQSGRIESILTQLKERGAFVVVDTPSALDKVDARIIAERVEGVVTVVKLGSTRRSDLAPYYRAFGDLPLLGVACNYHEQWIPGWIQRFL